MLRELRALGDDPLVLMRHILQREWLSLYQLRKMLHGKAHELHSAPISSPTRSARAGWGRCIARRRTVDGTAGRAQGRAADPARQPGHPQAVRARGRRRRSPSSTRTSSRSSTPARSTGGTTWRWSSWTGSTCPGWSGSTGRSNSPRRASTSGRRRWGSTTPTQAGFVHRDVKPSNIVVAGERYLPHATEPAVVKILDMGLDPVDRLRDRCGRVGTT